jgi:hypothetical protein
VTKEKQPPIDELAEMYRAWQLKELVEKYPESMKLQQRTWVVGVNPNGGAILVSVFQCECHPGLYGVGRDGHAAAQDWFQRCGYRKHICWDGQRRAFPRSVKALNWEAP